MNFKFRIWMPDEKIFWYPGDNTILRKDHEGFLLNLNGDIIIKEHNGCCFARVGYTGLVLEQWTGVKDLFSRLIFANDIVKQSIEDFYRIFIVEYNNNDACFVLRLIKTTNFYDTVGNLYRFGVMVYADDLEVIGNTHQNRNLMESEE